MNAKRILIGAAAVLAGLALWAVDPPLLVNYQGVLRNASGAPLTGSYDMTFSFFDATTGGNLLLTDAHTASGGSAVTAASGLFDVPLGGGTLNGGVETTLEGVFKNHTAVYLQIQVGSDPPMTPLVQVVSAAYAQNCHSLEGNEATAFAAASHTHDASAIVSGTLDTARGGTGLAAPGTAGNVLTSDGSNWTSSAPAAGAGWTISGSNEYSSVSGNVGIGTASPAFKLQVNGAEALTGQIISTVATGTAPFAISSMTAVTNLNADMVDGYHTGNASGYVPVSNGTLSTDLNADLLDGQHGAYYQNANNINAGTLGAAYGGTGLNAPGASGNVLTSNGTAWTSSALSALSGWTISGSNEYSSVSGNVGIGNPSPTYKLDITGTERLTGQLTSTVATGTAPFAISSTTGVTNLNADMLDGYHASNASGYVPVSNGTLNSNLNADLLNGQHGAYYQNANNINAGTLGATYGGTGLTSPGTSGNVLTSNGTAWTSAAPSAAASGAVVDAADTTLTRTGSGTGADPYKLKINLGNANSWSGAQTFTQNTNFPGGIWNSSGNVGIGTTSPGPGYRLDVENTGAAANNYGIYANAVGATATNTGVLVNASNSSGGTGTTYGVDASATGNGTGASYGVFGQATTNSSGAAFSIFGAAPGGSGTGAKYAGFFAGMVGINGNTGLGVVPTYQLQLSADSAAKPSTNTWTIASDGRLKKDIAPFTDGLGVIEKINPVTYKYNGLAGLPKDKEGIGVVAQEIKDVAPYTVGTFNAKLNKEDESPTELYDFNSHALTFVMINAIKELDQRTKSLASSSSSSGSSSQGGGGSSGPQGEKAGTAPSNAAAPQPGASGPSAPAAAAYPVCEPVEAGDVLVLDSSHPGLFCLGRQPADAGVVGIVLSGTQPAEAGAGRDEAGSALAPVATSGIVSCKADAAFGPIAAKDLLVVSPNPGHAMKAVNPAQGTVVGKALEPLESGTGLIKVLVMLR